VRSFLFALKHPHHISARRFPLKAERRERALWCDSEIIVGFGNDLSLCNKCNGSTPTFTDFGHVYWNDTGVKPGSASTRAPGLRWMMSSTIPYYFKVKEIEVFEIRE
jgi:hypothetical protein